MNITSFNRREKIKELLIENNFVSYNELAAIFNEVSGMTLRRDIDLLEREGLCAKVRGGAKTIAPNPAIEPIYSHRANENSQAKIDIALSALPFIETGRSVFLDSGTTIMELAKILPDINLSILTSAPNIALEVLKKRTPNINLIGGTINRDNLSVSGALALNSLKGVNIDIAFITPSGFSSNGGFTSGNYAESEVKRTIIKKASRTIVLMDSSKTGKTLPFTFANLKDIDVLVTDTELPDNIAAAAKKNNVELITIGGQK